MKNYAQYLEEAASRGMLDQSDYLFWSKFHKKNRIKPIHYSPFLPLYRAFN